MFTLRRIHLVVALAIAFVAVAPSVATAALDDSYAGTSSTNPNAGSSTWRRSWGNSLYPNMELVSPSGVDGYLYTIDRSADTTIFHWFPQDYDRAIKGDGAHFNNVFDIAGVYGSDAAAFDGRTLYPGAAVSPYEGPWFLHIKAFLYDQVGADYDYATIGTSTWAFGVDLTDPAPVSGVGVYPSATATSTTSGVITQSRANVRWDYNEFDLLSGTAYFKIYMDGKVVFPKNADPGELGSQTPWYGTGGSGAITIEDLPAGKHTFNVSAVDRATNEGPKSATTSVYVDPDIPTVAIVVPTAGGTVGPKPTFKAVAEDQAGVASVRFYVDGGYKGSVTPDDPPTKFTAAKTVDLSGLPNGTHTLLVRVYDVAGRSADATRSFKLDKTAPKLSSISGAPNPFYPRIREGYKDNFKVSFSANKSGTAKLVVKNSSGTVVRTISKNVGSGSNSIIWNGKYSDGSVHKGTFRYYLTLTDAGGQKYTSSTRYVSIRFTQVVRVDGSSVKVIER